MWEVVLVEEVDDWYLSLAGTDPDSAETIGAAIDKLAEDGPMLGRPLVDRVKGSRHHNMKEPRPGSAGTSEIRILFIFDLQRIAVLLAAGNKAGTWNGWYRENIPLAEQQYERWLAGDYNEER
ncbi:MAG TPA: type II toxin-antitoxin system RelE/ParE family toxin [Pseudonocardiaceae bacterium]